MKKRDLVSVFRAFVEKEKLFAPDDRMLVAVSGGLDSTTLAHLLHQEGYHIGIAHCNYQLREEDSNKDEQLVRKIADHLNAEYYSTKIDLSTEGSIGDSTQIAARRLRYSYFKKILDEYKYDWIVTAHHQQDSLETTFINLLRGTGHVGLTGIRPRRGRIVRPLLQATRDDLLAYARANAITWREDASNGRDNYLRNRIRHHLIPVLQQLGLHDEVVSRTLSRLRAETSLLEAGFEGWKRRVVSDYPERLVIYREPLANEPDELILLLLRQFSPFADFTDDQYRQMITVAGSRTIESASGSAEVSPTQIVFRARSMRTAETNFFIEQLPFTCQYGGLTYTLKNVARPVELACAGTSYLRITELPLHLRPRQNGDRIRPLGMNGNSKKVKALLNDLKLSAREKEEVLLLTTEDGRVMAVSQFRIAEEFSVGSDDRWVLKLEVKRKSPDLH